MAELGVRYRPGGGERPRNPKRIRDSLKGLGALEGLTHNAYKGSQKAKVVSNAYRGPTKAQGLLETYRGP